MRVALVFAALSLAIGLALYALVARRRRKRLARAAFAVVMAPAAFLVGLRSLAYLPGPTESTSAAEIHAGVTYQRLAVRDPRPRVVHVMRVTLATPGLRLAITRPDHAGSDLPFAARKTSAFAEETGAFAAMNGDFFDPWTPGLFFGYPKPGDPVRTLGTTFVAGDVVTPAGKMGAHLAIGPGSHAAFGERPEAGGDVLSGLCMLVEGGVPAPLEPCETKQPDVRHPRSAVGLDERRETLLLVVVDGRQPRYSQGAELGELAKILVEAGAYAAMNLDGGGSSSLVARNGEGRVEVLNQPIADRVPGRERPVANHLGVYFTP